MENLEAMLDSCECEYTLNSDGVLEVIVVFDDNRTQRVFLDTLAVEGTPKRACHIYSRAIDDIACLKDNLLKACLKNSSKHALGAWELRESSLYFCLKTVDDFTEDELRHFIDYVGAVADEFERKYCGCDIN